ncbi:hypothetical protein BCV70DRAFT_148227, partial [Testicularia cyperi]
AAGVQAASRPRPPAHRNSHRAPDISTSDHACSNADKDSPSTDVKHTATSVPISPSQPSQKSGARRTVLAEMQDNHISPLRAQSNQTEDSALAWLGELDRDELETMLLDAGRKIREREQKLMIAANIGKALLEKNLTLRSGIMTSMASSTSLYGLSDIEAMIDEFSAQQTRDADPAASSTDERWRAAASGSILNSPPTTDVDISSPAHASPEAGNDSDITPLAHQTPPKAQGTAAVDTAKRDYFSARPSSSSSGFYSNHPTSSAQQSPQKAIWVPSDAGLIASQPCSPSASIVSFASRSSAIHQLSHHGEGSTDDPVWREARGSHAVSRHRHRPSLLQLQALENQRQLASLSEQNDVLHEQISELQREAEGARRDGSKRLNRLNREIRGLKAELEAATRRNIELETGNASSQPPSALRPSPIRFAVHGRPEAPASPSLHVRAGRSPLVRSSNSWFTDAENDDDKMQVGEQLPPSTSNLEAMVQSAGIDTVGESALMAQLLAKIKELEETNAAMAAAEEDFGSRVGRAMEEDERLRDAYKAVEHSTVGTDRDTSHIDDTAGQENDEAQEVSRILGSDAFVARQQNHSFMTPSNSGVSLSQLSASSSFSQTPSSVSASPLRSRRAPGNRHIIEHRKTIRAAIRKTKREFGTERIAMVDAESHLPASGVLSRSSTQSSLGTYSIDLSAGSSAASSPRRHELLHRASASSLGVAGRPRIRITPSIEDLGRRRKIQEEVVAGPISSQPGSGDWQDLDLVLPSNVPAGSLKPSDALHRVAHRLSSASLSSLGDPASPDRGRRAAHHTTKRLISTPAIASRLGQPSDFLSPFSLSPSPSRVVRRSRSRSSSFGSDRSFTLDADPFRFAAAGGARSVPGTEAKVGASLPLERNTSSRGRTLGSELGSIFGGDDRKHDFDDDLPRNRRGTTHTSSSGSTVAEGALAVAVWRPDGSVASPRRQLVSRLGAQTDRPTANFGRLVPEDEEEHVDDLECILSQSVCSQSEGIALSSSPLRDRDASLLARVQAENSGEWLAQEPVIEAGGLQDRDEPRSAQFDLIGRVVERQAVAWADDDDYGKTISEREAVKLGLLQSSAATASGTLRTLRRGAKRSMLFGLSGGSSGGKRLEIESAEQAARRTQLETLLRHRRAQLLRERGYDPDWSAAEEDELAATYAFSPQRVRDRSRRALATRDLDGGCWPDSAASPDHLGTHMSTEDWVKGMALVERSSTQQIDERRSDGGRSSEEGEFEMLDCPTWKKQGGRGTDYFPTSFRARYHPAMMKQRATVATQMTYGWVEDWIQFALVVFLAFLVTVEQGPGRVLRGQR